MNGHTTAEKILAKSAGLDEVWPGDHIICKVDMAMAHDMGTPSIIKYFEEMGVKEVWDPSKIVCVMDHIAPSHHVADADSKVSIRKFIQNVGIENFYDVGSGISHNVLPEYGHIRPGELVVGTDSHTTSHGTFGAAGTGLGYTDMAYVLATGETWLRVPETIKFEFSGEFSRGVGAKDLILHIAGEFGTDFGQYKSIEYTGDPIDLMGLDDRFMFPNMSIELGAKFGFTPVDSKVTKYIDKRTDIPYKPEYADRDAEYLQVHRMDVSKIDPKISTPHKVGNVVGVGEVENIELDQVFIGSCTNGKFEDLKIAAEILNGNKVNKNTRLIVTPASRAVYSRALKEGIIEVLTNAGAVVTNSTCGACVGRGMGIIGEGEVCLAAMNRNFRGRMGSYESEIYLSSVATAATSAIAGSITDPRREL